MTNDISDTIAPDEEAKVIRVTVQLVQMVLEHVTKPDNDIYPEVIAYCLCYLAGYMSSFSLYAVHNSEAFVIACIDNMKEGNIQGSQEIKEAGASQPSPDAVKTKFKYH